MKNQKKFWVNEHRDKTTFPGIYKTTPSSSVVEFEKSYLSQLNNKKEVNILDLGTGNGRNAIFLAAKGYIVTGIDFAENAYSKAEAYVKNKNLSFIANDLGLPWKDVKSESIDVILDVNCSICIREKGRTNIIRECLRKLKKGGLYFFVGIGRTEWCDSEPGPELNSTIFANSGKFEKQYTKEELLDTYRQFDLLNFTVKKTHSDSIAGKSIDYNVFLAIFKKL